MSAFGQKQPSLGPADCKSAKCHGSGEHCLRAAVLEDKGAQTQACERPGWLRPGFSFYTYGAAIRSRNSAKWCQAGVMPNGTASAPAAKTTGAAHVVDRCTRRSESKS